MAYLKCGTHGRQKETYVCKHIIQTLEDGEPRGFFWNDVEASHEALCQVCNGLGAEEFEKRAAEIIRNLCYGCYRDAAAMNGVILDE